MMHTQLTLRLLLERPAELFPYKEIISRTENATFRYTYADFYRRVSRLANVLQDLGVKQGDRVAVMAWNTYRHLELYFAIPCIGATLHMVNFRLFRDQLSYVIRHAGDVLVFVDDSMLPMLEPIAEELKDVRGFVIMTDGEPLTQTGLSPSYDYEQLLAQAPDQFAFPDLSEESAAGICYTSATTGNPKGVVYSHRGLYLHSLNMCLTDTLGISERDTVMPVVPMFHANGWGFPYSATWMGATQVMPGPHPTPKDLAQLINDEHITVAAAVPTVWLDMERVVEQEGGYDLHSLRALVVGGSAAPRGLIQRFQEKYGVPIVHAYGMTETTPLATVSRLKSIHDSLPDEKKYEIRAKQGLLAPGLKMRVVRDDGSEVAHNGKEMGELLLQGPWIADSYYNDERTKETFIDGWLHTGDVVTVDEEGYIQLMDRTKDLVKSGGEWISTVELENALMAHPAVAEAAVIAIPHEKWRERPLACVVLKPEYVGKVTKQEIIDFLAPHFAKWWLPDDVLFVDAIPRTSTGKFFKKQLREAYQKGELHPVS